MNYLFILIEEIFFVCPLYSEPDTLHVPLIQGHVGVFPIQPDPQSFQLPRHLIHVLNCEFFTLPNKVVNSVFLYLLLGSASNDALFYLYLYRQAVHVPTRPPEDVITPHCFISKEGILYRVIPCVSYMGLSRGEGGSLTEVEFLTRFSRFYRFPKDPFLIPVSLNLFLKPRQIQSLCHFLNSNNLDLHY